MPGSPRPGDQHAERVHGDGDQRRRQRLGGVLGTIAANISTTAPIQEIMGEDRPLLRHRIPVEHQAEGGRHEHHVDQPEIENEDLLRPGAR